MNLAALIVAVTVSTAVTDYAVLSYPVVTAFSSIMYFVLFHYLLVMVYLMRYLYLLMSGGALEEKEKERMVDEKKPKEHEITV